jgi:hypothetical protein
METKNFICPYCNRATTITYPNYWNTFEVINIQQPDIGEVGIFVEAITCPNLDCKKLYLNVSLHEAESNTIRPFPKKKLYQWQLLPESEAKVLPDYIPKAIQDDYYEACRIRDLSPKASATLARRCLQGMIRDFWGIKKKNLYEEIKALEDKVDPLEWEAIDAVRKIGNIGAHMEKDINLIIDVEPEEAKLLIKLIEQLIDDWYIAKHEKELKLQKIKELSEHKTEERKIKNNETKS